MKINHFKLLLTSVIMFCTTSSFGQQDAQYTQYMYNTLSINPAYAGSRDVLSFVGLHRTQWVGLEGAPDTFTASLHSPIGNKLGIGLNLTHDQIFVTQETYVDLSFSYALDINDKSKLAFGIKGGGHFFSVNSSRAITGAYNPDDPDTRINATNKKSPQFGAGLYYSTETFYLGLSVPNLLETKHFDELHFNSNKTVKTATQRKNFYLIAGKVFDLNQTLKFKPAVLFKVVDGAPLQVDLSANFLIKDKFTIGAGYRMNAALSAMLGFQVSDQIMIGFAYDHETTELVKYNSGSYEFLLRYELFKRNDRMVSPRFF